MSIRRFAWLVLLPFSACLVPRLPSQGAAPSAPVDRGIAKRGPNDLLRGVNLAGADFGEGKLPGSFGTDYIYPDKKYVPGYKAPAYFAKKGMNVFRLPFRWERLQRTRNEPFDATELGRLTTTVGSLRALGAKVILDPHNYARYDGKIIGSPDLPVGDFADFWQRLADRFKTDDGVIFGLVNEPHSMKTEQWAEAANAAIRAIRSTGAKNLILVPGNAWSGAHSWDQTWYGTPNAVVMLTIEDPGDNFAFEVHQYLDKDSSGSGNTCVSEDIGVERVQKFTEWAKANKRRGFLGEFNGGDNDVCKIAVQRMLNHVEANPDLYLGWTYWAAGPWWGRGPRVIEPDADGSDKPQMGWLEPYLAP